MQTANPNTPWTILAPKGALAAVDKFWNELTEGTLGMFDAKTNKTVLVGTVATHPEVYFAVGGAANSGLYYKSRTFNRRSITGYTAACYVAPQSKIVELANACADCDTTYVLNVDLRSLKQLNWKGMAMESLTYGFKTSCCKECEDCPSGDCVEMLNGIMTAINSDPRGLITASMYAGADNGDVNAVALTAEEIAALDSTVNGFICPGLRITANPEAIKSCCLEPIQSPDFADFTVNWVSDNCCGTISTLQEIIVEQGTGVEWAAKAVEAAMYNGAGAWLYNEAGIPNCDIDDLIKIDKTKKYTIITLTGQQHSEGGLEQWNNSSDLVFAIECDDATCANAVATYLDSFVSIVGLPAQATIVSACDCA